MGERLVVDLLIGSSYKTSPVVCDVTGDRESGL